MPDFQSLDSASALLVLAVVLGAGMLLGSLAKLCRLPSVTGQILAGLLIGHAGFNFFGDDAVYGLEPLTHFALGLMAVTVGAHLNLRSLRNAGKRLFLLFLAEAIIVTLLVCGAVYLVPGVDLAWGMLYGTIAISTAPATIVAVVKEVRAKGVFVKTLIAAVALNNLSSIFLFEIARFGMRGQFSKTGVSNVDIVAAASVQILTAALLGCAAAVAMSVTTRLVARTERLATAGMFTILLVVGVAQHLDCSPLLACIFLGVIQTNVLRERGKVVDRVFSDFEPAILAVFFTLAGMALHLDSVGSAGLIALLFCLSRTAGKLLAAGMAMRVAGATDTLKRYLGMSLLPTAGVPVGLVVLLKEDPLFRTFAANELDLFAAAVLTSVVAYELFGPILTRAALVQSGDAGRDRMRLVDFIHEENILLDMKADTMNEAIEQLVDLTISSHQLDVGLKQGLLESALRRENDAPTALGAGLAAPHGVLPAGTPIVGVMAVKRDGFPFRGPDGEPVRCVVLLATPEDQRERHLQVLATLARTIGSNSETQELIYRATSAAHVYEALSNAVEREFQTLLDDESVAGSVSTPPT